jgi:Kef-type K+ transport system membrane component KefB/Trk K+ transport system NAD-binding subunit
MEPFYFSPLLLITVLAFFVPILTSSFKMFLVPAMVGEILCGMLVGKSGLNLIQEGPWLNFLYHFGFAYLMFLSGLEIDVERMRPRAKPAAHRWSLRYCFGEPLYQSLAVFFLRLLIATAMSWALWRAGLVREIWLMALVLSTTSVGVVLLVLKEQGYLEKDFGQVLLSCSIIADLITVILLTIGFIFYTTGWDPKLLLVGLLFFAVLLADKIYRYFQQKAIVRRLFVDLAHATSQIRVRGVFALILVFVVLAQSLGAEVILGSFLAGALVSKISRGEIPNLQLKLDAIGYGFFIPIFFIMVGVHFDRASLTASPASLVLVPLLIVMAYGVNLFSALILKVRFSWRETIAGGTLLSSRLSLIVAAAAIGLEMGAITPAVNSAIIIMALVTCVASPLIFHRLMKEEVRPARYIQIVGAGLIGQDLARRLQERGLPVVLLEKDPEFFQEARKLGLKALLGDGTNPDFLAMTGIYPDDVLILTSQQDAVNLEIALLARNLFDVKRIIARISDESYLRRYQEMEIKTVDFSRQGALAMENLVLRPNVFDVLFQEASANEIQEITIRNVAMSGKALSEIRLPGNSLILFIRRAGGTIIPHGKTRLYLEDILALSGDLESVLRARELFQGPPQES